MQNIKEAFSALPHVDSIWLTEDGKWHLHPHNGGTEISRFTIEEAKSVEAKEEITEENKVPKSTKKDKSK